MFSRNSRCELCWFAATLFGVGAYALIVFSLDFTAGQEMSEPRLLLIVLAGVALAVMAILIVAATRMERDGSR